jgi:D-psicose/D-tagatose/L-ribulose 3-epimerase
MYTVRRQTNPASPFNHLDLQSECPPDRRRQHSVKACAFAIESLNRFECYFLNTVGSAAAYVRRVAHPNFKTMFDTFHANIEEEDLPKAFSANPVEIAHVHVANNDRGVPGRGHIDFRGLFQVIKSSGYNGWLTIEAFGRALPELVEPTRVWRDFFKQPDEVVTQGYQFIRDTWNAV